MRLTPMTDGTCLPFGFEPNATQSGSRIGGKPPHVEVPFPADGMKYFATVELRPGVFLSVFYALDPLGHDPEGDVLLFNNKVLPSSRWLQAVLHPDSTADPTSAVVCEVSCHGLAFGTPCDDWVGTGATGAGYPFPHSKVGGAPFCDNLAVVGGAFESLASRGFRQVLQFETPSPRTEGYVLGFPWDPGWLHVFARDAAGGGYEFAFVIQQ